MGDDVRPHLPECNTMIGDGSDACSCGAFEQRLVDTMRTVHKTKEALSEQARCTGVCPTCGEAMRHDSREAGRRDGRAEAFHVAERMAIDEADGTTSGMLAAAFIRLAESFRRLAPKRD